MANRAYLQCLEGRTPCEIVASYSLPSAWLDLFGPEDFHTGNECSIKNACRPTTTTYLLAVSESKITIHFPIGVKTLVHRKQ